MAEEIKVSAMTFLDTVPDNARIYVVVPGDTVPYYTTKEVLLAGIAGGNIDQVLLQGNEIQSETAIVYPDNGVTYTIYSNGFFEFRDVPSEQRFIFSQGLIQKLLQGTPNRFISLVFDDNLTGQTEYLLTNEPGGVKIIASREWVNSQIDTAVVGLLDDRGNWNPAYGLFPNIGGSGTDGAVLKGDLWTISVAGTLGGVAVTVGDVIRALVDSPGQTASNWSITENNLGYVPENSANKATSMTGNTDSNTVFLSAKAVFDWVTGLLATASTAGITKLYNVLGVNTDGAVTQKAVTDALDLKADRFFNIKVPTTSYVTGTTAETEIYRLQIAPNTFSAVDILKLHRLLFQKIGAGGNFTIRVKLSTSATMPSGTTDQIAQFTGSNLSNSLSRTLSIFADSITGYAFNISFSSDSGPSTSSMSTALFNRTISQYLYISVTLANSADQVRLVGGQILNV